MTESSRLRTDDDGDDWKKHVTCVIVTYNSGDVLKDCIDGVPEGIQVKVVDNASIDATIEVASKVLREIDIIALPENLGFGTACNFGAKSSKTRLVYFLNPDAYISESAVRSIVYGFDDRIVIISPEFTDNPSYATHSTLSPEIYDTESVIGACMFVQREKFLELDGFDERIFLYGEDQEICWRARKQDLRVCVAGNVRAYHRGADSSSDTRGRDGLRYRLMGQGAAYVIAKHADRPRFLLWRKVLALAWTSLTCTLVGRLSEARMRRSRLRGTLDFLIHGDKVLWRNTLARNRRAEEPSRPTPMVK